ESAVGRGERWIRCRRRPGIVIGGDGERRGGDRAGGVGGADRIVVARGRVAVGQGVARGERAGVGAEHVLAGKRLAGRERVAGEDRAARERRRAGRAGGAVVLARVARRGEGER